MLNVFLPESTGGSSVRGGMDANKGGSLGGLGGKEKGRDSPWLVDATYLPTSQQLAICSLDRSYEFTISVSAGFRIGRCVCIVCHLVVSGYFCV
jgi:hypothetical protein